MSIIKLHWKMWLTATIFVIFGWSTATIFAQGNNQNTPFQDVPRTKFSCQGRGAGYYADIDTGCQVYHMCDGLGRQFSYSCPNTTLFQQRMLVCDHWYMVNCSRAESNYGANLLIGQKDKPFVPEEENEIRTPRPDLLDRPYAPDYSGESFRKTFKGNLPAALNSIAERDKSASKKSFGSELLQESASVHGQAIHWGTKYSQKGAFESTTPVPITNSSVNTTKNNGRRDVKEEGTLASSRSIGTTTQPMKNVELQFPSYNGNQKANQNGSPLSTTSPIEISKASVKTPSKIYEPPFEQPDYTKYKYNNNNSKTTAKPSTTTVKSTTRRPTISTTQRITTTTPRVTSTYRTSQRVVTTLRPATTKSKFSTTTPATSFTDFGKGLSTQNSFKAFENFLNNNKKTTHKDYDFSKYFSTATNKNEKTASTTQTPARAIGKILNKPIANVQTTQKPKATPTLLREPLIAPPYKGQPTTTTRKPSTIEPFLPRQPLISGFDRPINIEEPSQDLQPPLKELKDHDDASTQGPPIYYEWKWSVPAFILEPPVSAVQDSENSSSQRSTNVQRNGLSKTLADDIPPVSDSSKKSDNHSATTRSVTRDTANDDLDSSKIVFKKIAQYDYNNLQKQFLIPKFDFPLETVEERAADRYDDSNKVTSFQVKIPEHALKVAANSKPWYGENSKCPECHPSFLVPGKCEPCVKIRR